MKKSIILGGSILCLFILCSLSYQPIIADTPIENIAIIKRFKTNNFQKEQDNNITVSIQGGLGIKIEICNYGNTTLYLVNWSITIDGPLVILGRSISGSIYEISPGVCVTIGTMFIMGIGPINITIQIGDAIVSSNGYLIGPFVFLK